ncbi:MAG: hypothetical protein AAFZ15_29305 [Bacteroidota bacterium]
MRIFFFLSILFFSVQVQAQEDPDLPSEQVEVIKIFEAQLTDSEKVPLSPELPEVKTEVKEQQYEVPSRTFNLDYPAPRIRPISYKSEEEIPDIYNAYAKLGAGLPQSIYGEGAYHTTIKRSSTESYDLGLNLLHHSADFSSGDVENQSFGFTKAEGVGTYYFDQGFAVGANMGFTSDRVQYYGYNYDDFYEGPEPSKESVKQLYSIFDLGAKIFNGEQTSGDLNYSAGFDYYNLGDNFATSENGFDLKLNATKWIQEKHSFDLGIRTDFTWFSDTMELNQTLHNYTVAPSFTYHADMFKVKLGGKIISNDDEFELFPDIEAVLNLTGNELAVYAGVEGGYKKNSFRNLTDQNPYLHPRLQSNDIRNTSYFNVYGGVRGNLKIFEYNAQIGYKPTNDLAMFLLRDEVFFRDNPIYDFNIIYDDVDVINISGSISANPFKGLQVIGTLSQNFYDPKVQEKPWHLVGTEINFQAIYTDAEGKFKGTAQLFLQDGVWTTTDFIPGRFEELNTLYDLSLEGEYWFAKNFGAFLQLNNLLDNTRFRWYYYPTFGINVLGGITVRF